jgi:MoxR-like ATPase
MQERQITIDGHKHELALPFVVLATQNPAEYEGTYPLPEAELDRFMVRVTLGYPDAWDESAMLAEHADRDPVEELDPVADVSSVRGAQAALAGIEGTDPLRRYVVAICDATRRDERVELGASPRAGLMLFRAAKALAALEGRDHVLPDDVQALAPSVLAHRLLLSYEVDGDQREAVIREAIDRVPAL